MTTRLSEVELSEPARFRFKFEVAGYVLEHAISPSRRPMPGAVGRRMAQRAARERLLRMADRHAGRLGSALVELVRQALADYGRERSASVDQAVESIEAIVERVSTQRMDGEREVAGRRDELDELRGRIESLAQALSTAVEAVGRTGGPSPGRQVRPARLGG